MRPDTGRAGVVLAGGRSTRFAGADKATANLAGRPMIRHVVDAVSPVVDEVVVDCRRDQQLTIEAALVDRDVTFVTDPISDRGPVAGLRTGLRATDRAYAAVTTCDLPLVPSSLYAHLLERARDVAGAVPVVDGRRLPFPAGVHVRACEAACTEAITRGTGRLEDVIRALEPVDIPESHVRAYAGEHALLDVDTRGDLAAAERVLRRDDDRSGDGDRTGRTPRQ